MNYLKRLLEYGGRQQKRIQNGHQQSGEFQIIQFDENGEGEYQKEKNDEKKREQSLQFLDHGKETDKERRSSKNQYKSLQKRETNEEEIRNLQEKLSKQYTIIQIQDESQKNSFTKCEGSASTIKIDQYYMIVDHQQIIKKFQTQSQWNDFYKKINSFHLQLIRCSHTSSLNGSSLKQSYQKKKPKLTLTIKQLNSILQIKPNQLQRRKQYWNNIAVPSIQIKFKYKQLSNKKDPQKLQKNVTKIIDNLASSILFQIVQKKYKSVQNVEDQLQKWKIYMIKILTLYGANDKQIGYSKGLEYIVLGIIVAKPFEEFREEKQLDDEFSNSKSLQRDSSNGNFTLDSKEFFEIETHFKYLLFTKQLRNMYFPGTPILYQQVQKLSELMKSQVSELYEKLQKQKVDLIKLFINYYKTFLLYRLKNPLVIQKIMQLLLVYGIEIVRILLTRIMNKNQKKILQISQNLQLFRYLAQSLIEDYFGNSQSEQIISKLKDLFILDTTK